jgi:hypothetical protein
MAMCTFTFVHNTCPQSKKYHKRLTVSNAWQTNELPINQMRQCGSEMTYFFMNLLRQYGEGRSN